MKEIREQLKELQQSSYHKKLKLTVAEKEMVSKLLSQVNMIFEKSIREVEK